MHAASELVLNDHRLVKNGFVVGLAVDAGGGGGLEAELMSTPNEPG
jgi:hypothetical protein